MAGRTLVLHGKGQGGSSMTAVSTFRAIGPDGTVWKLLISDIQDPTLLRNDTQVSGFLPPREWTEDRVRGALMHAGLGAETAETLAEQVMAE